MRKYMKEFPPDGRNQQRIEYKDKKCVEESSTRKVELIQRMGEGVSAIRVVKQVSTKVSNKLQRRKELSVTLRKKTEGRANKKEQKE